MSSEGQCSQSLWTGVSTCAISAFVTWLALGFDPRSGLLEHILQLVFRLGAIGDTCSLDPGDPATEAKIRRRDKIPKTEILTRILCWWYGFKHDTMSVKRSGGGDEMILIHILRPTGKQNAPAPLPLVILFHGGGMVEGSAMDVGLPLLGILGLFSKRAVVASVEYRLAPRHKFPKGIEDCIDATTALFHAAEDLGCDKDNISIAGLSAGGYCAAVVHRHCAQRKLKLRYCAMFAPMLRYEPTSFSWVQHADQFSLLTKKMIWYWQCYCDPSDLPDPRCSPLAAQDLGELGRELAACLVATNTLDILEGEGTEYARLLAAAGVEVQHFRVHGGHFTGFVSDWQGRRAPLAAWERAVFQVAQLEDITAQPEHARSTLPAKRHAA
eukprot:CAMPEP_0181329164 /NCGR_PEP_ID=MMETSP1101-20121128/23153_1 /TAXON_ID=46948 /ORGANISM="Rhodomonas abbreviata, Strain Caron Lab Isolate" /LENGTH=382 /DNA_ID=CAMNT_0023438201 /DNA_START=51 /DNA_END=1199 /DNA_ORIENTATION=+